MQNVVRVRRYTNRLYMSCPFLQGHLGERRSRTCGRPLGLTGIKRRPPSPFPFAVYLWAVFGTSLLSEPLIPSGGASFPVGGEASFDFKGPGMVLQGVQLSPCCL